MEDMNTKFLNKTFTTLIIIILAQCSTYQIALSTHHSTREALEIIIGGGGDDAPPPDDDSQNCPPPPPPPPCPPPPAPEQPPPLPPALKKTRIEIARDVILQLKDRITIDPMNITLTWQAGRNACHYTGFNCVFLQEFAEVGLYAVEFNGYGFGGSDLGVDNFLEKLPDVQLMHANSNNFTGTINDLSKQTRLYEIDFSNNKYMGGFPRNVLTPPNLIFLDIRYNYLSGNIPPEVFILNLLILFVNDNQLEQELPHTLGSTPAAFLTLDANKFTGPIPNTIGNASHTLLEVLFLNNSLSGCLPYEIGNLKKTRIFDVSRNQLTGPIPQSFACMAGMKILVLAYNQFYGTVPELVCKLPLLMSFNLCSNYFTQVGPECMKLVRSKVLNVDNNCILGLPNQRSPQDCAMFFNEPKTCPDSNMMNYIPCKGKAAYLESNMALESSPQFQSPITYHALSPEPNN